MIYAGTSGWAYPSWKPAFYPPKLASKKFLEYYATRLNTVEVNYTFRRYLTEKLATSWLAATPAHFRFTFKAPQEITHIKRLRDAAEDASSFLTSLQPLSEAGKLGFVLFQLPPFLNADHALLKDFLAGIPQGRIAFEFRHPSWFRDETYATLGEKGAALCVAESEKLETPDVCTGTFCYYRLRKPEYSPAEQEQIAKRIEGHLGQGRDVYVYFKHEDTPEGALSAETLLQRQSAT